MAVIIPQKRKKVFPCFPQFSPVCHERVLLKIFLSTIRPSRNEKDYFTAETVEDAEKRFLLLKNSALSAG
jgi:hypothetical protein